MIISIKFLGLERWRTENWPLQLCKWRWSVRRDVAVRRQKSSASVRVDSAYPVTTYKKCCEWWGWKASRVCTQTLWFTATDVLYLRRVEAVQWHAQGFILEQGPTDNMEQEVANCHMDDKRVSANNRTSLTCVNTSRLKWRHSVQQSWFYITSSHTDSFQVAFHFRR